MTKVARLGINGFGRIGRQLLRLSFEFDDLDIVAINDPFVTVDYAKYLFMHDTVHGDFNGTCEVDGDSLVINGKRVQFFAQMNPEEIPWQHHSVLPLLAGVHQKDRLSRLLDG